jgi:hypothetical protein
LQAVVERQTTCANRAATARWFSLPATRAAASGSMDEAAQA